MIGVEFGSGQSVECTEVETTREDAIGAATLSVTITKVSDLILEY